EGKMNISELLSLKTSSKLNGDIKTGKLNIEPGAIFTGTCSMGKQEGKPQSPQSPQPPQAPPGDKSNK
ncbi:MAG: polymer-forming cytoskeletal protein, partial [Marinilabiliaceae bacterium]